MVTIHLRKHLSQEDWIALQEIANREDRTYHEQAIRFIRLGIRAAQQANVADAQPPGGEGSKENKINSTSGRG